jgi:hypothetical protein
MAMAMLATNQNTAKTSRGTSANSAYGLERTLMQLIVTPGNGDWEPPTVHSGGALWR